MKKIYLTNDLFNKKDFATLLENQGIPAYATDAGVVFDNTAFENYIANTSVARMPMWIIQNITFMKSDIHTLPLTTEELK